MSEEWFTSNRDRYLDQIHFVSLYIQIYFFLSYKCCPVQFDDVLETYVESYIYTYIQIYGEYHWIHHVEFREVVGFQKYAVLSVSVSVPVPVCECVFVMH